MSETNYFKWLDQAKVNLLNQVSPVLVDLTKMAYNAGAEEAKNGFPLFQVKAPIQIKGGSSTDDRGSLSFNNDLDLRGVRRYYIISNHREEYIRAWHGHPHNEYKVFLPVLGTFTIAGWPFALEDGKVKVTGEPVRFTISSSNPTAVVFPPGWMNGSANLTKENLLLVGSNLSVEESKNDDVRVPFNDRLAETFSEIFEVVSR